MTPSREIDYILPDCFLALGQAVGTEQGLDFEAVAWWHERYRAAFLHAMTAKGNSWAADRRRVTAVGRYLGLQAKAHAEGRPTIDIESAKKASAEVEHGCQMNAEREAFADGRCASPTTPTP
jgi:imidazolonepropionase-like amidohydrolase